MKNIYTAFALLLFTFFYSQVPQGFSYQTIAFNASGAPIANGNVSLRISILDNSATGTVLYAETQNKTTNNKGLVNLNIGQGTAVTGTFSGINWGTNPKFVKVEIDPAGGTNYTNVGVNQLMSVPYAMVSGKVDINSPSSSIGDDFVENKSTNFMFVDRYDAKVYAFNSKTGTWTSQSFNISYSINGTIPTVTSSNGNFMFVDRYDAKVYVFNSKTGTWSSQSYSVSYSNNGTTPTLTSSNGSFIFADRYDAKVYVFNSKTGTWTSQSYSVSYSNNGTIPSVVISNFNFMFVDRYDAKVYVFNSKTGTWTSQSYSVLYSNNGTTPTLTSSNGNFIFADRYDAKVYVFNSKTGTWSSQSFNVSYSNNGTIPTIDISETN